MNSMLTLLLFTLTPAQEPVADRVDMLHVNHVHDEHGREVLTQLIGWDFHCDARPPQFHVVFWRLMNGDCYQRMYPLRSPHGFSSTWCDGGTLRRVDARIRLEDWTQYDPELRDRARWPRDRRRNLTSLPVK